MIRYLNGYMYVGTGNNGHAIRYGHGSSIFSGTTAAGDFLGRRWNHACYVIDSINNSVTAYSNGVEVKSSSLTFDTPVVNDGFHIGARGSLASPINTFIGLMSNFKIYNLICNGYCC